MSPNVGAFHQKLRSEIKSFMHKVYDATQHFPREEIFGITSQLRRATVSVALNYTEGYARHNKKEHVHFLRISYGSLKEALYLLEFAHERNWIGKPVYEKLRQTGDMIGGMLWPMFSRV